MGKEIKAKYNCTQTELYAICRLGWKLCKNKQAQIILAYTDYTIPYIDDKITSIKKAEDLPDFQSRDLLPESAHILLKKISEPAILNWKLLERYIIRAFQEDKDLIKPNLEAAGKDYYEEATRDNPNWEDLSQMLLSGQKYITDNGAALTSMPATFPAQYDLVKGKFDTKYDEFTEAEALTPEKTREKIEANNEIFDDLMLMLGDINSVAPTADLEKEFTFTYLKGIISSPGAAGLKGEITEEGTGKKLKDVLLRLSPIEREVSTDEDGLYDFGSIPAGKYVLYISLDGYAPRQENVTIETGVTSTKDYTLKKLTPNP